MAIINPNGSLPVDILSGAGSIDIDAWIREVTGDLGQLIRNLFSNSEQGFAYDINDLSTLYQGAAGTIPVTTAGQPVGLVLDKSKGLVLGSEVVADPSFNNPAYWSVATGTSISGGNAIFSGVTSGVGVGKSGITTLGRTYQVTVTVTSIESGALTVMTGRGTGSLLSPNITSAGTYAFLLTALGTLADVRINANSPTATNATVSDISVKELTGNHAYQTTASMRPLLQNSPRKIDYDGVDDKLITTLPAQLTGCTVIRAVPNVGTQILTNQTIATPYNDSTDHCGLIVINRALTQTETAQITQIFNRLAGV